jgi:endonuclease YncB( thermonuclease family)
MVASKHVLVACLWASLALLPPSAGADTLIGKVVAVADGDTLTVLVEQKTVRVRVTGIDAPEKGQSFGQASKRGLSECAFGQQIEVAWRKKDRYGRTVGKVMAGNVDCGLRQVEQGLAWHYKAYAKEQAVSDRDAYGEAERAARAGRVGLWSDAAPVAPWEYRHLRHTPVDPQ